MKRIRSMNFATIFTIIVIALVTIFAELSEGFKNILKSITGHHWITKSLLAFVLFFGIYFIFKKSDKDLDVLAESWKLIWITLLASLVLFGFFSWHYFAK